MLLQGAHDVGDRGHLLPDRNVDALNAGALLIDDGVHGDGGFADLPVTDDQLALTAPDRHHCIDALQADLHGLIHSLAGNHARRHLFDRRCFGGAQRSFAVDGAAQRVHHASKQLTADRYLENPLRAAGRHALGEPLVVAQYHHAHRVTFEVHGHAVDAPGKLDHLAVLGVRQAVDADDAIGHADNRALVLGFGLDIQALDATFDDVADF